MTERPSHILDRVRQPGSPTQLALIRIGIGLVIFYAANSKIFDLLLYVDETQGMLTIFPSTVDRFIADMLVPYLIPATQIFAILFAVGLFTRIVAPLLFVTFLLLYSFYYVGVNAPIHWLYFWLPLLILCFCRCADKLSMDQLLKLNKIDKTQSANTYRWPIEVFICWFVYIYFAAGIAKVFPIFNGFAWLQGGTSQEIIYSRFLESPFFYLFGQPFFDYSSNHWVFAVLSTGALLTELACMMLLFTSRLNGLLFWAVMSMHFFLFMTGVAGFMLPALVLSIALVPPKFFRDYQGHDEVSSRLNRDKNSNKAPSTALSHTFNTTAQG